MRKSIDGLATLVQEHFNMDPYEPALFLFCGRRADRIKALLYKRLENGKFQWPRNEDELQPITWQQFRWLMEGLQVEQKHSIRPAPRGAFYYAKACMNPLKILDFMPIKAFLLL